MAEEKRTGLGEGIRTGIGILTAFKEAIEETLQEAVERGDLSPDRAKHAMKDAAHKVQETLEEARERLDFVSRRDFDALAEEVRVLKRTVRELGAMKGVVESGSGSPDIAAGDHIPID